MMNRADAMDDYYYRMHIGQPKSQATMDYVLAVNQILRSAAAVLRGKKTLAIIQCIRLSDIIAILMRSLRARRCDINVCVDIF